MNIFPKQKLNISFTCFLGNCVTGSFFTFNPEMLLKDSIPDSHPDFLKARKIYRSMKALCLWMGSLCCRLKPALLVYGQVKGFQIVCRLQAVMSEHWKHLNCFAVVSICCVKREHMATSRRPLGYCERWHLSRFLIRSVW